MAVTVMDWERALRYVNGRFDCVLEPGRHSHWWKGDVSVVTVDMRPRQLTVRGQELMTADGVTIRVTAVITWKVIDPVAFHTAADNTYGMLYSAAQEAVRDNVAAVSLDDAVADRSRLSSGLTEAIAERADGLGIEVTSATARDLMLPGELRRAAMDRVVARERGRAELERARGEAAALRSLANTAQLLERHPTLLHLRTLQAAEQPGAKVVLAPPNHASAGAD